MFICIEVLFHTPLLLFFFFYFSTDTISVDVQKQIKEITQAQVNNNKYSHSILRGYENNSWQADL